jgi:hypothetical protein
MGMQHELNVQTIIHECFFLALVDSLPYEGVFPEAFVIH